MAAMMVRLDTASFTSQKTTAAASTTGKNVGSFHNDRFSIDKDFRTKMVSDVSISSCSRRKCNVSEVIVQNTDDRCCWHCRPCTNLERKASDYECKQCPEGHRSDGEDRSGCELIPETYLDFTHKWAIVSLTFASFGIILTFVTAAVLWKFWDTPVVKACGRELSLLLLCGTFLSFATNFAIVARPSVVTCGIMRFSIGFCYTVCYAAVVTKTNRVARIFSATSSHPRFTSPLSSILIASGLISVEVIINVIWVLVEPPSTKYIVTHQIEKRVLVCNGVNNSFMAGLIYPFFLIFFATLYAFKTRKCPGGFNETKFIFFANSITCLHWFAYVPLYLVSTDPEFRAVILAFSLSLSGIVQLGCLLFPKVYTVLFKPEKNTRGGVMTQHRSRVKSFNIPPTPPNSVAIGVIPSDNLLGQYQHWGTLTKNGSGGAQPKSSYSVGNIPAVLCKEQLLLQAPNPLTLRVKNADLKGRQLTWSSEFEPVSQVERQQQQLDQQHNIRRARSSSECKGTQTFEVAAAAARDNKKIKFRVSLSSQSPSVESILDKQENIPEEDRDEVRS